MEDEIIIEVPLNCLITVEMGKETEVSLLVAFQTDLCCYVDVILGRESDTQCKFRFRCTEAYFLDGIYACGQEKSSQFLQTVLRHPTRHTTQHANLLETS